MVVPKVKTVFGRKQHKTQLFENTRIICSSWYLTLIFEHLCFSSVGTRKSLQFPCISGTVKADQCCESVCSAEAMSVAEIAKGRNPVYQDPLHDPRIQIMEQERRRREEKGIYKGPPAQFSGTIISNPGTSDLDDLLLLFVIKDGCL